MSQPKPRGSPGMERGDRGVHNDDDHSTEARQQRRKRAKYTAVACKECKKRKIKCSGEPVCPRCARLGLRCEYIAAAAQDDAEPTDRDKIVNIEGVVNGLQKQLDFLVASMKQMQQNASAATPVETANGTGTSSRRQRTMKRKEPHFLGLTNPAFSLDVGRSTLETLGIQAQHGETEVRTDSLAPSQRESPEPSESRRIETGDPICQISLAEVLRLTQVYKVDLAPIYPFVDVDDLSTRIPLVYSQLQQNPSPSLKASGDFQESFAQSQDVKVLKFMVATALVLEGSGRSSLGQSLVDTLDSKHESPWETDLDIQELQILAMRSIYYFHRDDEVMAWRTIGVACRMSFELGLHRTATLMQKYPDPRQRMWVSRLFWSIYVLDRRWSFGTGMPFALHDSDMDSDLPTDLGSPYLECLVAYARLSSKVWSAIASSDATPNRVNKDIIAYLDFQIQQWVASIPPDLQVVNLQTGEVDHGSAPSVMLGIFLHLRGNHLRTLIHRHNVMSSMNIKKNLAGAQLVSSIARNTISVLVNVNKTSELYTIQQNAFSYFLVSALAAIFLAVCHAPAEFAHTCRHEYYSALDLVKSFSTRSSIARRLWKVVRDLKQVAPQLGLKILPSHGAAQYEVNVPNNTTPTSKPSGVAAVGFTTARRIPSHSNSLSGEGLGIDYTMPVSNNRGPESVISSTSITQLDCAQMSNDLTTFFEAFGQDDFSRQARADGFMPQMQLQHWESMPVASHTNEVSRLFDNLF